MSASRVTRTGTALGQLLLVVVLAAGVFLMHTVGHPPPDTDVAAAPYAATAPYAGTAESSHGAHESTEPPLGGMDLAALCVAVLLGAWAFTALLRAAFARRSDWLAPARAATLAVLRPNPPPPRPPDLAHLSVLRI
ncbi:DUF6153 family protein [Streptomyces sp. E11-3]|uniref:DUF6153 family protein n=1 Tax=Streptomyces sp. E11-3 TaxID=3110112 RepID=UPI0039812452